MKYLNKNTYCIKYTLKYLLNPNSNLICTSGIRLRLSSK